MPAPVASIDEHIRSLIAKYSGPDACAAALLCDGRDAATLAYRIIDANLVANDLSYGSLRTESEQFASALEKLGVVPGNRVATLMGKSRLYLVTLMAIWRLGAVHVPLFTAFAPSAIALRLSGSGATIVVCDAAQQAKLEPGDDMPAGAPWRVITTGEPGKRMLGFRDLMREGEGASVVPATLGGDAPIIHVFTSGTTGAPKGVVVPMRALAAFEAYATYGFDLNQNDVFWCAADPGWAYGLYYGVLATFTTGVRSILFEGGFSPEATFAILARERVTNFAAAPTVYRAMRSADIAPPEPLSLRCGSSAGEPLTPDVNAWAEHALGVQVHDHYGQTEVGMLINNHHHAEIRRPVRDGSMGQAMPGWSATVLHELAAEPLGPNQIGRVAIDVSRSPLFWFDGYAGDTAKTAEKFDGDGRWYLTGDTGHYDEDGYFYFSARDDDVIIMAGYRIGPFEVESAMASHVAVAESAVIAVPDEVRGEVIEAYVVLKKGYTGDNDLERDIQAWVKSRFAAHAYPRTIHFVDDLPKTPSGKVQRFILKQRRLAALKEGHAAL